jgi:hypothetical protein
MTAGTPISPDVRLLCLNAMCDNNLSCAKNCLNHVTSEMNIEDVQKWSQCTYSTTCSEVGTYLLKEQCADRSV